MVLGYNRNYLLVCDNQFLSRNKFKSTVNGRTFEFSFLHCANIYPGLWTPAGIVCTLSYFDVYMHLNHTHVVLPHIIY